MVGTWSSKGPILSIQDGFVTELVQEGGQEQNHRERKQKVRKKVSGTPKSP